MVKLIFGINFLDAFTAGVFTVLVPLLMLSHGIGVATIGMVFALAPLLGVAVRIAASAFADMFGQRFIYSLNAACTFLEAVSYAFFPTAAGFSAGKLLDGAGGNLIFAVNRPGVVAAQPNRKHFGTASLMSGRTVYKAIGSLAVGSLFGIGGYGLLLSLVAAIGVFIFLASLGVKNSHFRGTRVRLSDLSPLGRGRLFYEISGAMVAGNVAYSAVFYIVLPIFFSFLGYSLAEIGAYYAAYFLIQGLAIHGLSHASASTNQVGWAALSIFIISSLGMAFGGPALLPAFFLFMAFADACGTVLWEELNYLAIKGSRKPSTVISVATSPCILAAAFSAAASGFAISTLGFASIIMLFAATEAIHALWCMRLSRLAHAH